MRGFGLFLAVVMVGSSHFAACGPDDGGDCLPGQISCGLRCTDPTYDRNNCGFCNNICSATQTCSSGLCVGSPSNPCSPINPSGDCPTGLVCINGACSFPTTMPPACTLTGFSPCTVGGTQCCAPLPDGTQAICSIPTVGTSYCAPRCSSDAYCESITRTSGTWYCGARGDGVRVCFIR